MYDKGLPIYIVDELSGIFRGHPLDGVKMDLPEGYTAVVVTEAKRPLAEDADRRFQVKFPNTLTLIHKIAIYNEYRIKIII